VIGIFVFYARGCEFDLTLVQTFYVHPHNYLILFVLILGVHVYGLSRKVCSYPLSLFYGVIVSEDINLFN
jgi:hypothetical protein